MAAMKRWLMVAVILAGCSQVWVRPPDKTDADFNRDWYECKRDAAMLPRTPQSVAVPQYAWGPGVPVYSDPTLGWGDLARELRMRDECMLSKGYQRQ